jgi:hypothetical protein
VLVLLSGSFFEKSSLYGRFEAILNPSQVFSCMKGRKGGNIVSLSPRILYK